MNRFSGIFNWLLQLFPRLEFYKMVKETKEERLIPAGLPVDGGFRLCPSINLAPPVGTVSEGILCPLESIWTALIAMWGLSYDTSALLAVQMAFI